MTDKELRRMSRGELLELLIAQATENERLKQELEQTQAALQARRIAIGNAGSLAEAAMQLNGVFDAAQTAAQQYLENLQWMSEQQDAIARKIEEEAGKKAEKLLAQAAAYSREQRREADDYSRKTHEEADAYWQRVCDRVNYLLSRIEKRQARKDSDG